MDCFQQGHCGLVNVGELQHDQDVCPIVITDREFSGVLNKFTYLHSFRKESCRNNAAVRSVKFWSQTDRQGVLSRLKPQQPQKYYIQFNNIKL